MSDQGERPGAPGQAKAAWAEALGVPEAFAVPEGAGPGADQSATRPPVFDAREAISSRDARGPMSASEAFGAAQTAEPAKAEPERTGDTAEPVLERPGGAGAGDPAEFAYPPGAFSAPEPYGGAPEPYGGAAADLRSPTGHGYAAFGAANPSGDRGPEDIGAAEAGEPETGRAPGEPDNTGEADWAWSAERSTTMAYQPVTVAPPGPRKAGIPSSGNLKLPEWMRDGSQPEIPPPDDIGRDESAGRSKVAMFAGVGLLVVALIVAAAVYVLKGRDTGGAEVTNGTGGQQQPAATVSPPPDKALIRFPGPHTPAVGRIIDRQAGLSYARLGAPWQRRSAGSPMAELGFAAQQYVVTEQRGSRVWYGQLMSGTLSAAQQNLYAGPGTEKQAAVALADEYDARFYAFRHTRRPLASQQLTVAGRKGWLVVSRLGYRKPGINATGEVVAVAVVDTGRERPAVLFMAVPNTHKRLWADINFVLRTLRPASA